MKSSLDQAARPLRIVIGSEFYRPSHGGTEVTTQNLVRGLIAHGHEVLVVAPGRSWYASPQVEEDGERLLRVRAVRNPISPQSRLSLWPYGVIYRQLDRFQPDIIQVNNHFGIGQALVRYGRSHSIPVVAGLHFMPESILFILRRLSPALYQLWLSLWWQRLAGFYNQANQVVGPSQQAISYLTQAGLTQPTQVISNGINLQAYQPAVETPSQGRLAVGLADRPTILCMGRISPEKQLEVVITAMVELRRLRPELRAQLVMVGDGWARPYLQRLATKYTLEDDITWTGYVAGDAAKLRYLAAADVFVMPSTAELQSIVTLEAMATGKPIVAVAAGALPELVLSGETGELFPPRDGTALAQVLADLLDDTGRRQRYGRASRRLAETHDLDHMPAHYEALYYQLAATAAASSARG